MTVPSTANPIETAFMAFVQQNAIDREADRQASAADREADRKANEARDARMTELLGVLTAIYHDCDDDIPADSSHDHFQNIALVRNDTLMNSLGVVSELKVLNLTCLCLYSQAAVAFSFIQTC